MKEKNIRIGFGKKVEQLHEHRAQRRLALARLGAVLAVQEQLADLLRGQHLVAQVQRHHEHLAGNRLVVEDLGRGLRVDKDVELGVRRRVADALLAVDLAERCVREAAADGAAHDAQALDVRDDLRILAEQRADVGHGAGGHDPGRAGGLGLERGRHCVNGRHRGRSAFGRREQLGAVEAAVAVDIGRCVQRRPLEGLVEADVEGDVVVLAQGRQDGSGIVCRVSSRS